jgi:hypothetical protein
MDYDSYTLWLTFWVIVYLLNVKLQILIQQKMVKKRREARDYHNLLDL